MKRVMPTKESLPGIAIVGVEPYVRPGASLVTGQKG
jgi:hypothetical protein